MALVASAQAQIKSVALGPDKIETVNTAQGITTRLTFPEPVQEIICGDLYDPASGKGTFVVQRSGSEQKPGNDVFVKPIAGKGISNLFVKTGDDGKHTYNFDLVVVAAAQAHRVINVTTAQPSSQPGGQPLNGSASDKAAYNKVLEQRKAEVERAARAQADEIIRNATQQASRIVAEAESKVPEIERNALERAEKESEKRFQQALLLGLREAPVRQARATAKNVIILLDPPRVWSFDDKAYVRFQVQNNGPAAITFGAITLEVISGEDEELVPTEMIRSKAENSLAPGEAMTCVAIFDPKVLSEVTERDRLRLYVRGADKDEIVYLSVR